MARFSLGIFVVFLVHSALGWPDVGKLAVPTGTGPLQGAPHVAPPVQANANTNPTPKPDEKPKVPNFEENAGMLRSATDFLYSYLPGRQNTEKLELLILAISDLRAEIKSLKMELGDLTMRMMPKTPTTSDSLLPNFHYPILGR